MRTIVAIALALTLAGCGMGKGGEDFAVTVEKSPDKVKATLGAVSVGEAGIPLSALRFSVNNSTPGEVSYTIPMAELSGSKLDPGVIRLVLEPGADGKSTVIHAHVDVPPVRVLMGKKYMVLSESKVENELRKVLKEAFKPGSTPTSQSLSQLLAEVAIAGNHKLQADLNTAAKGGAGLDDLIDVEAIDPPAEAEVPVPGDGAAPDPAADIEAQNQPEDPYADAAAESGGDPGAEGGE
jgi:hypothetical protein